MSREQNIEDIEVEIVNHIKAYENIQLCMDDSYFDEADQALERIKESSVIEDLTGRPRELVYQAMDIAEEADKLVMQVCKIFSEIADLGISADKILQQAQGLIEEGE